MRNEISGARLTSCPKRSTFKPVDGVRTFGAILAHVAGASYEFCAAAKGEMPPP